MLRIAELIEIKYVMNNSTCPTANYSAKVYERIFYRAEQELKNLSERVEFLFNFESGGWNSEYAHTMEEAKTIAKEKYIVDPNKEHNSVVDYKTFRQSTASDKKNLMSLFY